MEKDFRNRGRVYPAVCPVGERPVGRLFQAITNLGIQVIHREWLCAAIAVLICSTTLVPGILIFYDRALPFEYVDTAIMEKTARPGDTVHFRLTARRVKKECRGHVDRIFIDQANTTIPLKSSKAVYNRVENQGTSDLRIITVPFQIPEGAAPGEGTYVSFPEFWCYPLQFLVPIQAPPLRAKIVVLPPTVPRDSVQSPYLPIPVPTAPR
jgi:hypothetical protein